MVLVSTGAMGCDIVTTIVGIPHALLSRQRRRGAAGSRPRADGDGTQLHPPATAGLVAFLLRTGNVRFDVLYKIAIRKSDLARRNHCSRLPHHRVARVVMRQYK